MKKITNAFIILFLFFIGLNVVDAKTLENTCTYIGSYTNNLISGKEVLDITISCKFYDDNSQTCDSSIGGSESIMNWGSVMGSYTHILEAKAWYSKNKKCFDYLVFFDKGSWIDRYEIIAADSFDTANSFSSYLEALNPEGYDTGVIPLQGLNDGDELQNFYDQLDGYIASLNKFATENDPWSLDECLDDEGKLNTSTWNSKVCANRLNQFFDDVEEWNEEIDEAIDSGLIDEDDSKVKEFNTAEENARAKIDDSTEEGFEDDAPFDDDDEIIDVTPGDGEKSCVQIDGIYYDKDGNEVTQDEFEKTCKIDCGLFGGAFGAFLKDILSLIRFVVPLIILGLSIIDFIKATAAQNESEIKKAATKLVQRMIVGVLIFVLPTLLEVILAIADIPYGTCGIK